MVSQKVVWYPYIFGSSASGSFGSLEVVASRSRSNASIASISKYAERFSQNLSVKIPFVPILPNFLTAIIELKLDFGNFPAAGRPSEKFAHFWLFGSPGGLGWALWESGIYTSEKWYVPHFGSAGSQALGSPGPAYR